MKIIEMKQEEFKGLKVKFEYTTNAYYDCVLEDNGFVVKFIKKYFENDKEKSFDSTLFEDYFDKASCYGIFEGKKLLAFIEINRELWAKRVRITNIHVLNESRRKGYGSKLMSHIKEIAKNEKFRAIILETQSCNVKAIDFYMSEGFTLGGYDLSCYSNNDIEKKEVRMEFVYYL